MEEKQAPQRPRFALPSLAWVAAGVCASAPLLGVIQLAKDSRLTAEAIALAGTMAILLVSVPFAAAWVVWHVTAQKPAPRNISFFVTLAVLAAVLFTHAARQSTARFEAAKSHARLLASELVERELGGATQIAKQSPTENAEETAGARAIGEARKAAKARHDAVRLKYEDAAVAVAAERMFDLKQLDSAGAIAERRRAVDAFARATRALLEAGTLSAFQFTVELRDRGVPEDAVREAVDVYRGATKRQLPRLKQLRDNDGAMVLLMSSFLEFAEAQLGKWRVDPTNREIKFDDPAAKARHDEMLQTRQALESERDRLRRELGGGRK